MQIFAFQAFIGYPQDGWLMHSGHGGRLLHPVIVWRAALSIVVYASFERGWTLQRVATSEGTGVSHSPDSYLWHILGKWEIRWEYPLKLRKQPQKSPYWKGIGVDASNTLSLELLWGSKSSYKTFFNWYFCTGVQVTSVFSDTWWLYYHLLAQIRQEGARLHRDCCVSICPVP